MARHHIFEDDRFMSATLLDGKRLSKLFEESIRLQVRERSQRGLRPPGLAVILVGDSPASKFYVGRKTKIAKSCGLKLFDHFLPEGSTEDQIRSCIQTLNEDAEVDGILLQLPVPGISNADALLESITPTKDVDGLHSVNQGKLLATGDGLVPCTPQGVMALLDLAYDPCSLSIPKRCSLAGKRAVVIGRSRLVGKPLIPLLLSRDATVTAMHSKSQNPKAIACQGDILIVAAGQMGLVDESWIKPGAVVIDVGIHKDEEGKIRGDVNFDSAAKVASAITPVPGGVGPMTVICLIQNTLVSNMSRLM